MQDNIITRYICICAYAAVNMPVTSAQRISMAIVDYNNIINTMFESSGNQIENISTTAIRYIVLIHVY